MISFIVIAASLVFAAAYLLAWLVRPGFRRDIERPKHWFQNELYRYDRRLQGERETMKANDR
jgi:hypothetical protein